MYFFVALIDMFVSSENVSKEVGRRCEREDPDSSAQNHRRQEPGRENHWRDEYFQRNVHVSITFYNIDYLLYTLICSIYTHTHTL